MTTTQDHFGKALEHAVTDRGYVLVVDREWANTGTMYATAEGGLSAVGARVAYDFQERGRMTFRTVGDDVAYTNLAALSATGTADWCYKTAEEVLAVVLDAIAPAVPDDPGPVRVATPFGEIDYGQAIADAEALEVIADAIKVQAVGPFMATVMEQLEKVGRA